MASSFTHSKLFKQISFYTQKLLHTTSFYTEKLLPYSKLSHTTSVYTQNTYTQCFYIWQAFAHIETETLLHTASFYRKKFLHRGTFLYIITTGIAAPKPDLGAKAKKTILKHFLKGLEMKITSAQIAKICWQIPFAAWMRPLQYDLQEQLHKTIVVRMQPQHQATLTQPLQCLSQHHVANLHVSTHMATPDDNNHAAIPMRSATADSRNA